MIDFDKIWTRENVNFTRRVLGKLEADPHLPAIFELIDNEKANIWLVLAHLAKLLKVDSYAELGVRRGFSMAIVGARCKAAHLVGFDNWQAGYGGAPNPGPDFVKSELAKTGHTGEVEFITGDCATTVAAYQGGPFPLILADAGHTYDAVYRDIVNCLALLEVGGYLVVDDLHVDEARNAFDKALIETSLPYWSQDRVGVIWLSKQGEK